MSLRFRIAIFASLLGAAFVLPLPAPSLCADDGGDGKDGEPGKDGDDGEEGEDAEGPGVGEGESGEAPTLEGAIDVGDSKRFISVRLPKAWTPAEQFEADKVRIGVFVGPITAKAGGAVELIQERSYSRAAFALSVHLPQLGATVPGEARSGPGWAEGAATFTRGRQEIMCWERAMEKDGAVYAVRVLSLVRFKDDARALARQILDTAKISATPARPQPPAGFTVKKTGDYEVWSDAEDKGRPGKTVDLALDARGIVAKALKGKPFDESKAVLRAYENGSGYVDLMTEVYGAAPDFAAYEPNSRSLGVQLYRADDEDYPFAVREAAARQYLGQYFGGLPPVWLDVGLRRYAAIGSQSGGKPDKPKSAYVDGARLQISKKWKRLDEWMDVGATAGSAPDAESAVEIWAWHVFLRHGAGKKYSKQYQASIDALRQTGDLAASRKAWDGVDFKAMTDEFRGWVADWK